VLFLRVLLAKHGCVLFNFFAEDDWLILREDKLLVKVGTPVVLRATQELVTGAVYDSGAASKHDDPRR
jgi:hypothetical protein